MNAIIALKHKSLFKKKAFGMAGAAALIIAALFLAGCNTGVGYDLEQTKSDRAVLSVLDDPSIAGTWRYEYDYTSGNVHYSGYEEYVITLLSETTGTLSYTFYDNPGGDYGLSFTADIVDIVDSDGTSGIIIIQYDDPPYDGTANWYNAVYFQNLSGDNEPGDTVQLANAVNLSDYSSSQVHDLIDAETDFTWENVEDYIFWSVVNEQIRQAIIE
jgi:hypothetical protein